MFKYVAVRKGVRDSLTASSRLAWPVCEVLRQTRPGLAHVLAEVGLDEATLFGPETRIRLSQLHALWSAAVAATGDPALGARVASLLDPASPVSWPMPLALFEHLGRHAEDLAQAVTLHGRFMRLMRDGIGIALELDADTAVLRIDCPPDEPAALVEFNLATAICIGRRITQLPSSTREVWLMHPGPADVSAHAKLFRAPVRFGAPFNALIGTTEDYRRPLPRANSDARRRIVGHAELLMKGLPSVDLFEDRVCAQIERELPHGNTNASAIAESLGVSTRTLYRRLQTEGLTYQELLDRVRFRLAVRHLGTGKAIGEVALLVGFAQPSTFHRAFKSWTGETPAEYQERYPLTGTPSAGPAVH